MTDPSSQISDSNRQNISGSIRISSRQKGNPVLKHIRKVPWEFEEGLVADYILGPSCVALYLSRLHTRADQAAGPRTQAQSSVGPSRC